ncbi:unnamed protein product [Merluccius merluccius]
MCNIPQNTSQTPEETFFICCCCCCCDTSQLLLRSAHAHHLAAARARLDQMLPMRVTGGDFRKARDRKRGGRNGAARHPLPGAAAPRRRRCATAACSRDSASQEAPHLSRGTAPLSEPPKQHENSSFPR